MTPDEARRKRQEKMRERGKTPASEAITTVKLTRTVGDAARGMVVSHITVALPSHDLDGSIKRMYYGWERAA